MGSCPVCAAQKSPVGPQPSDGPEYHADRQAWRERNPHLAVFTKEEILRRYPDRVSMAEAFAKTLAALWAKDNT